MSNGTRSPLAFALALTASALATRASAQSPPPAPQPQASPPPASAQPPAAAQPAAGASDAPRPADPNDPVVQAREHFAAGVEALDQHNWARAITELERSYQLRRSHVVSADLGRAYAGAGYYAEAREAFSRALTEGQGRWTAEALASLRDDTARVEAQLGRLRLRFVDSSARVRIDRRFVEDPREVQWLEPGSHHVTVTREGFQPAERDVTVRAGQQETWDVSLTALAGGGRSVLPLALGLSLGGAALVGGAIGLGVYFSAPHYAPLPRGTWTPVLLTMPLP